jgi:hypothetical protein
MYLRAGQAQEGQACQRCVPKPMDSGYVPSTVKNLIKSAQESFYTFCAAAPSRLKGFDHLFFLRLPW